jgi:hypothetical protein
VRQVPATAPGMTPDPEGVSRFSLVVMAAPVSARTSQSRAI